MCGSCTVARKWHVATWRGERKYDWSDLILIFECFSAKMKNNLRRFNKVWKAAYKRLKPQVDKLVEELGGFAEEDSMPEQNITNRIDSTASEEDKVKALGQLTKVNLPKIQRLTRKIDKRLGTHSKVSVKTDKSIVGKANRPSILAEDPWFRVEHIRDSLRFMTAIKDVGQIGDIMGLLVESGIKLVKIDVKKLLKPKKWGWRFVAFDLRMENGQICEYYITFEKLARVMWDTHRIYEKWRQAKVDKVARRENPQYLNDVSRSKICYSMAFLSSLNDGKYGPTTFLERWIETLDRFVTVLKTGVLPADKHRKIPTPDPASVDGEEDEIPGTEGSGKRSSTLVIVGWVALALMVVGGVCYFLYSKFFNRKVKVEEYKLDKIL